MTLRYYIHLLERFFEALVVTRLPEEVQEKIRDADGRYGMKVYKDRVEVNIIKTAGLIGRISPFGSGIGEFREIETIIVPFK